MRLMLVDDEPLVLDSLAEGLALAGHECHTFSSPLSAALAFECEEFDAVIADYRMPGMSGADLARVFQKARPEVPVYMMSGYPGVGVEELRQAGAREFFWKPFSLDALLKTIGDQPAVGELSA